MTPDSKEQLKDLIEEVLCFSGQASNFRRETFATSRLNNSNICVIYGD